MNHSGHNSHNGNHNHSHGHSGHIKMFRTRFIISAILSIPVLLLSEMIQMWFGFHLRVPYQSIVVFAISTIIYIYGGWPFLKGIYKEISDKQPGMMTLIGFAISVAFFYSTATTFFIEGRNFFWELATLIDVMLLGHWIEAKSVAGASKALDELAELMPKKANRVKDDGEVEEVDVSELKEGDTVLVKPGENIPADGEISEGQSHINESLVTGESKPVSKSEGDEVIGGSINGKENSIKIEVSKSGKDSYLAQVMDMVSEAQQSKSKSQDTADKAAAALFYLALGAGIITYAVWAIIGSPDFALERSVTVMVIACPHALGLAIPLVVAISTSITAKNGILVRNRQAFETIRNISAIVFDKTGTLTKGEFEVNEIITEKDEKEFLRYAAAVEQNSEHIIAEAIVKYTKENDVDIPESDDFSASTGKGVSAEVDGKQVRIGGPKLLKEINADIDMDKFAEYEEKGNTVVFVFVDDEFFGAVALSDQPREESADAIKQFRDMGIKVYMLTGDSEKVASAIAEELGVDEYFAEIMPDEKADKVKELSDRGETVAMVGDGINDAPALARADIGIAIGAGTSVAIESAEIVLVKSNIQNVIDTIKFSEENHKKMIQNLWWAAGYNIVALPLAAGVLSWAGIIIQPAVGALLMSASTVIVAINAQTLRKKEI